MTTYDEKFAGMPNNQKAKCPKGQFCLTTSCPGNILENVNLEQVGNFLVLREATDFREVSIEHSRRTKAGIVNETSIVLDLLANNERGNYSVPYRLTKVHRGHVVSMKEEHINYLKERLK